MTRFICIHGHFYQPPRENPWLERIELQDSAYPYHDWNERVTAECYSPNAASRILDEKRRILQIVNNYSKISFNFGPTLLSWLEQQAPDIYNAILDADQESRENFSGHGTALAQAYNHMILPLANSRDKDTQVVWGIRDFEHRFGRKPEGMWLPETAVNLETLEALAVHDIRFTILSPHQAGRVRLIGDEKWEDVSQGKIDPTMAYSLQLPSGRHLALFFYDGILSHAVGFEQLLANGEFFAKRLLYGFSKERTTPQLVHIATDGETYGHHHRFGDMALAYALREIEAEKTVRLTNYGEFLQDHPPTHEVEIFENTSWSCVHGIERWKSDCGCHSGEHPEWRQAWRGPLRVALDWLRDTLAPLYEEKGGSFLNDPWQSRNDYIQVILDRSPENVQKFLDGHISRSLNETEKTTVLNLLELQRFAMLMYTSCGWFFDDISGLEAVQVIRFAGRTIQISKDAFGDIVETRFLELLKEAESNISEHENGFRIYEKFVKPAMVDLSDVCAHYAMNSLFEKYEPIASIYCYTVERKNYQVSETGKAKLLAGSVKIRSNITGQEGEFCFGVLHLGDHNLICSVKSDSNRKKCRNLMKEAFESFAMADFPEVLRLIDQHFGVCNYSLRTIFRDEQRKILNRVLEPTVKDAEAAYRRIYENNILLLRFLKSLFIFPPKSLSTAAELVLNFDLQKAFKAEEFDIENVSALLDETRRVGIPLYTHTLEYALRQHLEKMTRNLLSDPMNLSLLEELRIATGFVHHLPFEMNMRKIQDTYYDILKTTYPRLSEQAEGGDGNAEKWVGLFKSIGENLSFRLE